MTAVQKSAKLDELPLFDFEVVENATNKFHLANTLGKGGFGPVYKVIFSLVTFISRISRTSILILLNFFLSGTIVRWSGNCSEKALQSIWTRCRRIYE